MYNIANFLYHKPSANTNSKILNLVIHGLYRTSSNMGDRDT